MDTNNKKIFDFLIQMGVNLSDVIHLLCNVNHIKHKDIANSVGLPRERIYMMTSGKRPVSDAVRNAFKELLGLDPWDSSQ